MIFGFVCSFGFFSTAANAAEFWVVKFAIEARGVQASVGQRIELPVYITNQGLLTDSYNVNTTVLGPDPGSFLIETSPIQTVSIESNQTEKINVFIQTLMQGSRSVRVNVVSDACTLKLQDTVECKHDQEVVLSADYASLPDVDVWAACQIFVIAAVVMISFDLGLFKSKKII